MRTFINALSRFAPIRSSILLFVMLLASALEGAGLLLLIPLLTLTGLTALNHTSHFLMGLSQYLHQANWTPSLNEILVIYVLLVISIAMLSYFKMTLSASLRLQFCEHLRNETHQSLLKANWSFLTQQKRSDLAHALTTETMRVSTAIHQFIQLISTGLLAGIYLLVSLTVAWPLALICLGAGTGVLLVCRGLNRRVLRTGSQLFSDNQTLYARVFDHLNSLKIAKSSCLESQYQKGFECINASIRQDQMHFSHASALTNAIYQGLSVIVFAVSFGVAFEVAHVALANLLIMLVLFARLFPRLNQLQSLWQNVLNLLPAFTEIEKLKNQASGAAETASAFEWSPFKQMIQVESLSFQYPNRQTPTLKNINLNIRRGERIAIVGESGSGKTTLVDCLSGLMIPQSGQILIDGNALTSDRLCEWRKQIAYFTQDCFLFSGTVSENLRLVKNDASNGEIWRALKQADAAEFVTQMGGLEVQVGDQGNALSGGQRQRICIARTLLQRPRLLILDEATSQIDELSESQIAAALTTLGCEMSVVLITHRPSLLDVVDRVVELKDGHVAKSSTLSTIRSPGVSTEEGPNYEKAFLPRI